MHLAIVDDCPKAQAQLLQLVTAYFEAHSLAFTYDTYLSAEALLGDFTPGKFQLLFLDIYMDGISGMDAARAIYGQDSNCRLIFATTSLDQAVASYDVRAAWYLVKPIQKQRLFDALDVVYKDLAHTDATISLHSQGIPIALPLEDILFADCQGGSLLFHLTHSVLAIDEKVVPTLNLLTQDSRFLLCNRNVVVNLNHVSQLKDGEFLLTAGHKVPIRLRGQAAVKKAYLEYSLRNLRGGASI